jgi:XTP/dITP diphosphohydrolase
MKNIIIASSNEHKISEIITTIKHFFDNIYSLSDFPEIGYIKEDGTSIVENSFI